MISRIIQWARLIWTMECIRYQILENNVPEEQTEKRRKGPSFAMYPCKCIVEESRKERISPIGSSKSAITYFRDCAPTLIGSLPQPINSNEVPCSHFYWFLPHIHEIPVLPPPIQSFSKNTRISEILLGNTPSNQLSKDKKIAVIPFG